MLVLYVSAYTYRGRGRRKSKFFLFSGAGHLDRLALKISRHWHKDPGWFLTLSSELQTDLIADYILDQDTQKQRDERKKRYNVQQARRMRERLKDG